MSYRHSLQENVEQKRLTELTSMAELVKSYASRLATCTRNEMGDDHLEKTDEYIKVASKSVKIRGQEFTPFAPFRQQLSAFQTVTFGQALVLSMLVLVLALGLILYGTK